MQMSKTVRKYIESLRERASKLAERVLYATQASTNLDVRREGARFSEVLDEWLEEIDDLYSAGDDAAPEKARSFSVRLKMAEAKVTSWGVPEVLETQVRGKKARGKARTPTRTAA